MSVLRFAQDGFFYFLLLVPVLILFYYFIFKWKTRALQRFGNLDLINKLSESTSRSRQIIKATLVVLGILFMILALARPQLGTELEEVKREGVDIFVALDVSMSMLAEDIKPNRLAKAKHEISSFIDLLRGDRIGLIAFAGEAFIQCPLTLDYGAAKTFLDIMDPKLIPEPGTNLRSAIELAMKSFETQERKYKVLVLITDGEDHGKDVLKVAEAADKEGLVIYTVGIGSPSGVPIPLYDDRGQKTGFKKDRRGEVILTKLDASTLEKIALTTNGMYYQSTTGETKLESIYEEVAKMEKKELASMKFSQYEDRFQWILIVSIIMLMLEPMISERRKMRQEWRGRFE
ncbi:VWA domain-containing protein [candidate division KSB1 bacterium]|nr:VWA domain-containing protein [candidate division KSB1 bacterium]NIR71480.1 VWA domain-containing protein [candidate division KSB1 bacterium]NIS23401.1 VWA domain-containing protein [candidate division KSB1 bacterium]NIT70292.1 VWA domain-containing protein [candidate division KSB1 bacterium]NIU24015.1 VWA domain-containing protein [candidate division KSB1 bacterium]